MTWKAILKKLDYNEMSDDLKTSVVYMILNDTYIDEKLEDYFKDIDDTDGESSIPEYLPFPDNFGLRAYGNINAEDGELDVQVDLYAYNEDDEKEQYYMGGWYGSEDLRDLPDFSTDIPEGKDFEELSTDFEYLVDTMVIPQFQTSPKPEKQDGFRDADFNKLVSYLKEAGEWNEDLEDGAMRSMKKDTKKVEHSPKIKQWLDEAQEFGAQQFEQSASPDDEDSIRGAKEYYDLLDYLGETDAKKWNKSKLTLKYPYAMTIVSESLDGLPTGE